MNYFKIFQQGYKVLNKFYNRTLKKLDLDKYLPSSELHYTIKELEDIDIILTNSYYNNIVKRQTIVKTLKDIKYERKDTKWTSCTAIAFMEEVMSIEMLFEVYNFSLQIKHNSDLEKICLDISNRYNVPISRFNTQLALFIRNWEQGNDKFEISEYFSIYEIVKWKYRDVDKLQQDIENNKITDEELQAIRKLYNI